MFPLVESWLTQKEFSQQHQISDQVFYYWVARYRKAQPVSPLPGSGPVVKTKPVPAGESVPAFIRLSSPTDPVPAASAVTDTAIVV